MRDLATSLLSFLSGIPAWAQEHATYPLAVVGVAALLVFSLALFVAIMTAAAAKQARRRKVPEYTEEYPYMPRRALRVDVENRLRKAGINVVKEDAP